MATIVLEKVLDEPVSDEQVEGMRQQVEACLEINGAKRQRTILSADRTRFVCIFEADDTEAVRRTMDSAGMPYDRVWIAALDF
jgi:hypothetical protein